VHGVIGGFHLDESNERIIPETVAALRGFDLKTNHVRDRKFDFVDGGAQCHREFAAGD
jgi:hypothetical protein